MTFSRNKKGSAIIIGIGLLVTITFTFFVGFYIGKTTTEGNPTSTHENIAEVITLFDIELNIQPKLQFVQSFEANFHSFPETLPLSFPFYSNTTYTISEWKFTIEKDPDAYMNIWGSGNDGQTFFIEIISFSGHEIQVNSPSGSWVLDEFNPSHTFTIKLSS